MMVSGRVILALLCVVSVSATSSRDEEGLYVNEWAVKIPGGERVAREVAADHGFQFDGQIGRLPDTYAFLKKKVSSRSRRAAEDINYLLAEDERVSWMEQQRVIVHAKKTVSDVVPPDETGDDWAIPFNDPLWNKQWYLYNDGQQGATPGMDMNLMPAWKLGYTGKGVVVTIVDDGVDQHHPDLRDNFDLYASYDFNNKSNKNSPHPDLRKPAVAVRHGTRCAGEVAAAANNSICGVGVAYEASIGGVRLLDGATTDRLTAEAIQFNNSHVDIYSCCWGPVDDGTRFEMPHRLTKQAFEQGAKEGRNGKGSIFVWASGNGGDDDDHCGADGYVGNIHSISISAINDHGRPSFFVESCPANMAVTLSGGPYTRDEIVEGTFRWNLVTTTDLYGNCTTGFVGTSSAAPLASGSFAIVLQANPLLTWRDVQYIITEGSKIPQIYDSGWWINGAGLHVHHNFGFGVLDVAHMVELALTWDLVGPQEVCNVAPIYPERALRQGKACNVTLTIDCPNVRSMEHTEAILSFIAPRRGDISLVLYSPFGTPSQLLATRKHDRSDEGLTEWPFMSVHNWGEDPNGEWTLEFRYNPTPDDADLLEDVALELYPRIHFSSATLIEWGMTIYGLSEPRQRSEIPEDVEDDEDAQADGEVEVDGEVDEDEDLMENPGINLEDAGKSDSNTIEHIYNNEQRFGEEIIVDPEDIVQGIPLPPNAAHNMDDDTGLIETGSFDGHLLTKLHGLTLLAGFAKRLEDGDPIIDYLMSLDERSLEMLSREFALEDVLERMLKREEDELLREKVVPLDGYRAGGNVYQKKVENNLGYREKATETSIEGKESRRDEVNKREEGDRTEILQFLRSLDADVLQALVRELENLDNNKRKTNL